MLVAAVLIAWVAEAPRSEDGRDRASYQRVLKDPDPSAEDIVDVAGAPSQVARAGDGSLLLAYYLDDREGGEDGAVAWRVYDRGGKQVSEHGQAGYGSWDVYGVAAGFVFAPAAETSGFFIDARGHKHDLKTQSATRAVQKGDVLVSELEPTLAYRPATGTLAPLGGLPDDYQHVAIDERGTTWAMPMWEGKHASIVWTAATGRRERHTFGLPGRTAPQAFAAGGGTAVVSLAEDETVPDAHVRALAMTSDRGATWRTLKGVAGLPLDTFTEPSLAVLADGRVLIGERDQGYWLADRADNPSFRRLDLPAKFDEIVPLGGTLYGIAEGKGLWRSTNQGRTWARHEADGSL